MTNIILDNTLLILLLPFWIFLIIMSGRFFSVYVNKYITYALTLVSSFLGIVMTAVAYLKLTETIEWSLPFIKINNFVLSFGIRIDKLSVILALILFLVSFAVQIFSVSYLNNDKKNYRFFALLNLFNFAMTFMLFSPNLFQLYVFWELIGIVSYLLIGFDYGKEEKSQASKRVFLMNRFGDTALIAAILLTSYYMYNYGNNLGFTALEINDLNAISTLLTAYSSHTTFCLICVLFIIASVVKSAQFPFHTWLQDAMEAKLPVSALLHSATMVVAGIYLIIRLMPFFTLSPSILKIAGLIGLVTISVCSVLAVLENHPKKILAYSTSANLGFMLTAAASENIYACIVFLTAHAFTKSALFLLLPDNFKENNKKTEISYINFILFVVFSMSLAGIILAGNSAKEILLAVTAKYSSVFFVLCLLPAVYMTKLLFLLYKNTKLVKSFSFGKIMPVFLILGFNVFLYLRLFGSYADSMLVWFVIPACIFGLIKYPENPHIFERLYNNMFAFLYNKFSGLCQLAEDKVFCNYAWILFLSKIPIKITGWIEENIMNRSVKLTADTAKSISKYDMILQSKNVQTYNTYAFMLFTVIIILVITGSIFMYKGMN